jgi:UDPglucose 6-dehydrogenase
VAGADLLCVLTDWQEFRELDPAELGEVAAHRTVLDTRHVLDPERWRQAGWRYRAPGRPATAGPARRVAGQRRAAPAADRHR